MHVLILIQASDEDDGATGDLDVVRGADIRVMVRDGGAAIVQASSTTAAGIDCVFDVSSGGKLSLTGLSVRNGNAPDWGGGIWNNGTLTLTDSTVSGNSAPGTGGGILNWTGDLQNSDPKLGPQNNNGGPTQTQALLPDSPAIDAGTTSGRATEDPRGVHRPRDGDGNGIAICDIGVYGKATL